jgi:hypothetical protein
MNSEIKLNETIDMLWVHRKTQSGSRRLTSFLERNSGYGLGSEDIEVLGYVYALLGDHRFLVGPELSLEEYLTFIRRYYLVALSRTPMASGPTAGIPQAGIWLVS